MMNFNVGLVGLPNAGKSTLFNALTSQKALVADYPFATIKPNHGIVKINDHRLLKLAQIFQSPKVIPAQIEFLDIAGLIKGASSGEGLGNQFLGHIRHVKLIVQVVKAWNSTINQIKTDLEIINLELQLKDLETVEKQIQKISKLIKSKPGLRSLLEALQKADQDLKKQISLKDSPSKKEYVAELESLNLLTLKPRLLVFNLDEKDINNSDLKKNLAQLSQTELSFYVSAQLEMELIELNSQDRQDFLKTYKITQTGLENFIQTSFKILELQTFLTAGNKEVRAWLIRRNTPAKIAAGLIHSDIQKGFIVAEVVNYQDLIDCQSWTIAKEKGFLKTEGKDYLLQTDDVVKFRFNL